MTETRATRSEDETHDGQRTEHTSIATGMGRFVQRAHHLTRDNFSIHPYNVFFNSGLVVLVLFPFAYDEFVQSFAVGAYLLATIFTIVMYELVYDHLKRRIFGIDTRSYLQDLLVFVLPVAVGSGLLLGVELAVVLDLVGLQLAIMIGFIRIGCFFGGCCYGIHSKFGILYPKKAFEPHEGKCQSFSPGEYPERPVFPIQLVESALNFGLFAVLFYRLTETGADGTTLPIYLAIYASYRIVTDFFRLSSARPNYGPLSEAQVVSLLVLAGLGIAYAAGLIPV